MRTTVVCGSVVIRLLIKRQRLARGPRADGIRFYRVTETENAAPRLSLYPSTGSDPRNLRNNHAICPPNGEKRCRCAKRASVRAWSNRRTGARAKLRRLGMLGRMSVRRCLLTLAVLTCTACSLLPDLDENVDSLNRPAKGVASYNKPYRVKGKSYVPLLSAIGYKERGRASWYGSESGKRTASGARFDPRGFTAAHKTLPIPCRVRVTNLRNGRQVDVLVTDRGPFAEGRLIDLSKAAAEQIGMRGTAEVSVEYLAG